jgi:hypothetical protein
MLYFKCFVPKDHRTYCFLSYAPLQKITIPVLAGGHIEFPEIHGQEELLHVLTTINISAPAGAHREVPKMHCSD